MPSFKLKTPRYYIIIMLLIPLFLVFGGAYVLPENNLAIMAIIIGILFGAILIYGFKDIIIDKNELIIRNILIPKKQTIKINKVKKASFSRQNLFWPWTTLILEIQTKKDKKYMDIRTNYNSWDTTKFLQVFKKILGKKFVS